MPPKHKVTKTHKNLIIKIVLLVKICVLCFRGNKRLFGVNSYVGIIKLIYEYIFHFKYPSHETSMLIEYNLKEQAQLFS